MQTVQAQSKQQTSEEKGLTLQATTAHNNPQGNTKENTAVQAKTSKEMLFNTSKTVSPTSNKEALQQQAVVSQATTADVDPRHPTATNIEQQRPQSMSNDKLNIQAKLNPNPDAQQESTTPQQSIIASLQQRSTSSQAQQQQSTNPNISQGGLSTHQRILESSGNTASQQDLNAQQHDTDVLFSDSNKSDSKAAKALDFQAQLAYKSQRSFTPADTMLEIVRHAKSGNSSIELQLEPAHLGKVHISLQLDAAKQVQVMFTVDQQASRQALEQQMPQLRLALAQQGLDLGSFSMQMNQQQHGEQQHGSSSQQSSEHHTQEETHNPQHITRTGINLATDGHISILA